MDKKELFQIGDVAKMFQLSVSSLRHYESLGLLKPEYIDKTTGYRYYGFRQFEILNTIRYLRVLDMPLPEIIDFLKNKDVELIQKKLEHQKKIVIEKQNELNRIEHKIDNRLRQIKNAQETILGTIELIKVSPCKIAWLKVSLKINGFLDMEEPIRNLEKSQPEAVVFPGKVGVGIDKENLLEGNFNKYDYVFLVLDDEDQFEGETITLPETLCVSIHFRGSHTEAGEQYKKLMRYINEHKLEICVFSREITMIDYGITNDVDKFVSEIRIPVICK